MKRLFMTLLLLAVGFSSEAKITMPAIFGDNMVLQQEKATLWGRSDASKVTVAPSWSKKAVTTEVKEGVWSIYIATPKASFDKHSLTISDADSKVEFRNILVGEVWICSGQSNMYMPLRGYVGQPVEGGMTTVLESPQYADRIRMVTLPTKDAATPQWDFVGKWEVPSIETTPRMSAAAYYFARTLVNALNVPVGIVSTSWGGSRIEAWMSPESLTKLGYDIAAINAEPKRSPNSKCCLLYNGLIAPVAGYTARGFTWYQGEANRGNASAYAHLMELMVDFWRTQWGDTEKKMPFLYAQIAPYRYNNAEGVESGLLVEAQADALKLIPNSAMASTGDTGELLCIHPKQKREVGDRLALEALQLAYGHKIPDGSAPQMESVEFKDGKAIVLVTNCTNGVCPRFEPIVGFEIAGEDGTFYPATATISKTNQITVTSDKVKKPVAVRYSFRNYAPGNVANTYGLPLVPFRSDR